MLAIFSLFYIILELHQRTTDGSNGVLQLICIVDIDESMILKFNPFTLRAAKRGLKILEIFPLQKHIFGNI